MRAGRARPAEVTLVAVSKTVHADRLRDALAAGITLLGENRVQEAAAKAAEVAGRALGARRPAPGQQGAEGARAVRADPAVDSLELAQRLDRIAGELRPGDRSRSCSRSTSTPIPARPGFDAGRPRARPARARRPAEPPARRPDDDRPPGRDAGGGPARRSAALRALSRAAAGSASRAWAPALSMGMTDDYPVAIEEGATIVRVGRAIFGERHHHAH